ncbi:Uncharacterized conserved protein, DUF2267 family [Parapedobacter composti]|uniref:Uncharacterized conserved protein, DUF2267 family n=1 Tax=Parapedobacter composti TaxID=623281 RepID=A0A1I1EJF1_9SPHI|nr:DUF2267 domain-containing protein [Parapedobacter composti]SFB85110.1 Uncharacterized conserved protein, DUF2267 family [Parapedobacter composti]
MEHHFEKYAEEGNLFLKKVAAELGAPDDRQRAFRLIQAVFQALRDRITVEESMHLIAELPMILKAVYVNGWNISEERRGSSTVDEFLNEILEKSRAPERDFGDNPEEGVAAVFRVIRKYVSPGEYAHVKGQLTPEIATLLEA